LIRHHLNEIVVEVEVPTEFVKVTVTVPSALVSPLKVNGTFRWKLLPTCTPLVLENQTAAMLCSKTGGGFPPFRVVPFAAWKVNVALMRSRVVE